MQLRTIVAVLLLLLPLSALAGNPLPVNANYDSQVDGNNVQAIKQMGYETELRSRRYYHFKFKNGWIVRYYFATKVSTIPFVKAGQPTRNTMINRELEMLIDQRSGGILFLDSGGGASYVYGLWAAGISGFSRNGVVTVEDCDPECPEIR